MIAEEPTEAGTNGVYFFVGATLEVPYHSGRSYDELSASDEKGAQPEETEYIICDNSFLILVPHHLSHELQSCSWLGPSDRVHIKGTKEPK